MKRQILKWVFIMIYGLYTILLLFVFVDLLICCQNNISESTITGMTADSINCTMVAFFTLIYAFITVYMIKYCK